MSIGPRERTAQSIKRRAQSIRRRAQSIQRRAQNKPNKLIQPNQNNLPAIFMRTVTLSEGTEFTYGQNAQENSQLTRSANQNHFWLHVANQPSAHGILKTDKPIKAELVEAATIIKQHSKSKDQHRATVDCIPVKQVKIVNDRGTAEIKSRSKAKTVVV